MENETDTFGNFRNFETSKIEIPVPANENLICARGRPRKHGADPETRKKTTAKKKEKELKLLKIFQWTELIMREIYHPRVFIFKIQLRKPLQYLRQEKKPSPSGLVGHLAQIPKHGAR